MANTINCESKDSSSFIRANKKLNLFTQTQKRQQRTKSWSGFNKKKTSIDYSFYDLGRTFNSGPLFTCNSNNEMNLSNDCFIRSNLDDQYNSYGNFNHQHFKFYLKQTKFNNSSIAAMRNINTLDSGNSIENNNLIMNNKKIVPILTGKEKFCSNLSCNNSVDTNCPPVPTNSFDRNSLTDNLSIWSTNNFGKDPVQRLEVNQKKQSLTKPGHKLLLASSRSNSNASTDKPNESSSTREECLNGGNKSDIRLNIAKVANAFQVVINKEFFIKY